MSKKKPDITADAHSDEVVPAAANPETNDAPVALVRMTRDGKTASVHPDELANYAAYGWQQA